MYNKYIWIFKCFVIKFVNYVKCVLYSIMYTIFLSHEIRLNIYLQFVPTLYIFLFIFNANNKLYWRVPNFTYVNIFWYLSNEIQAYMFKIRCLLSFNTDINILTLTVLESENINTLYFIQHIILKKKSFYERIPIHKFIMKVQIINDYCI